jgi:hypothetical protein
VSEIGLYERGSLGFLPVLWIGIIIECFQSFGISCKNHILLIKKMLGHAPSKKEIPTLKLNDIPYESSTDKSNLFAENFSKVSSTDNYSSQFKIHKQQVENNDHNNITDHSMNYNNFPSMFAGYHVTVFYTVFLFLYNF